MSSERTTIRSYRRVFRVDRRIYRIDRWMIPVPGGVPLRSLLYFASTLLAILVLGALPGVGTLIELIPPPYRLVILPLGVAVIASTIDPDGRSAHRYIASWLAHLVRPKRRSAGRVLTPQGAPVSWHASLPLCGDHRAPELERGRVRGPAFVEFRQLMRIRARRRGRLVARPASERGKGTVTDQLALEPGQLLEIRP